LTISLFCTVLHKCGLFPKERKTVYFCVGQNADSVTNGDLTELRKPAAKMGTSAQTAGWYTVFTTFSGFTGFPTS